VATTTSLSQKAQQCLALATEVPGYPLWHMGKATLGSRSSFELIQKAIDYLSCKARAKLKFEPNERDFLKSLFEALWWGGKALGYSEAATLANHYVNGAGQPLKINDEVYRTAVIVKDTSAAMKDYIRSVHKKTGKTPPALQSDDAGWRRSAQFKALGRQSGRSQQTQGIVLPEGALQTEQANVRLQRADNRFYLKSFHSPLDAQNMNTRWRVDSVYDFEPFEKKDYITHVPLAEGMVLQLPDGLSHYMTVLGVAQAFDYHAQWHENWTL
jgi:hypothetical protein